MSVITLESGVHFFLSLYPSSTSGSSGRTVLITRNLRSIRESSSITINQNSLRDGQAGRQAGSEHSANLMPVSSCCWPAQLDRTAVSGLLLSKRASSNHFFSGGAGDNCQLIFIVLRLIIQILVTQFQLGGHWSWTRSQSSGHFWSPTTAPRRIEGNKRPFSTIRSIQLTDGQDNDEDDFISWVACDDTYYLK